MCLYKAHHIKHTYIVKYMCSLFTLLFLVHVQLIFIFLKFGGGLAPLAIVYYRYFLFVMYKKLTNQPEAVFLSCVCGLGLYKKDK